MMTETSKDLELFHYGIKGMKWGVRRKEGPDGRVQTSNAEKPPRQPMSRNKKIAIAAGAGAIVLGLATTAVVLKTNGNVDLSKIPLPSKKSKKIVDKALDDDLELSSILWATRGKNVGAKVLRSGGVKDPIIEMEKAGFDDDAINYISRYGDRMEKITANIIDPEGRTDRAGRGISHNFLIPEHLAKDINTLDDVKSKIWPMVSEEYDKFYKESLKENWE